MGRNIDFNGTSGDVDLLDNGDVSTACYEQFVFDASGNDRPMRTFPVDAASVPDG